MSNPTTPFSWQMPTATDLVTDLPADFEVFGQAVATSMADLLGGTTGQVLSKTTNADMDFTWVAANPGDITAVTAGTGISGGGTSGAVTITNSMATEITAKGDLIAGTGSATFDNLPVGTNGQTLVADSTASTGLKWATPATAASGLTFIASASPSAVTSQSFNNCFSATYQNYLIVMNVLNSVGEDPLFFQMRVGGVVASGSDYDYLQEFVYSTSQLVSSTNNAASARCAIVAASVQSNVIININRPFDAAPTVLLSNEGW